jgi:hypothetical protein
MVSRWFVALCLSEVVACGSSSGANPPPLDGSSAPGPDAAVQPGPQCAALPATCGASGHDSCCTSLAVPGGTYFRSYDVGGDSNAGTMNAPATVSAFQLDKYEVTVGRYRTFIAVGAGTQAHPPAAGTGAHAKIAGSGWDPTWNGFMRSPRLCAAASWASSETVEMSSTYLTVIERRRQAVGCSRTRRPNLKCVRLPAATERTTCRRSPIVAWDLRAARAHPCHGERRTPIWYAGVCLAGLRVGEINALCWREEIDMISVIACARGEAWHVRVGDRKRSSAGHDSLAPPR